MDELSINPSFRSLQSNIKKLGADILFERINQGSSAIDTSPYLIRTVTLPIDIYSESDITPMIKVVCNLPLTFETIDVDYYSHLDDYIKNVDENDVADTGELVYTLNVILENYEEADFEFWFGKFNDMFDSVIDYATSRPRVTQEVCSLFLCFVDILIRFYPRDYSKQYTQIADRLNVFRKYAFLL